MKFYLKSILLIISLVILYLTNPLQYLFQPDFKQINTLDKEKVSQEGYNILNYINQKKQILNRYSNKNAHNCQERQLIKKNVLKLSIFADISLNNSNFVVESMLKNSTDVIISKHDNFLNYFEYGKEAFCYDQLYNHIPGSSKLTNKYQFIQVQQQYIQSLSIQPQCLLEVDFLPKSFDLIEKCDSFLEYLNIDSQQQFKFVKNYYNFEYEVLENTQIDCKNNKNEYFLATEVQKQPYLVKISILVASTEPYIVFIGSTQQLQYYKYDNINVLKCVNEVGQKEFNSEAIYGQLQKYISHIFNFAKSFFLKDPRFFEIFQAYFSIDFQGKIELQEINGLNKIQDYDLFLNNSLEIVQKYFKERISRLQKIENYSNEEEKKRKFKQFNTNSVVLDSNENLVKIIDENLYQFQQQYPYIHVNCEEI